MNLLLRPRNSQITASQTIARNISGGMTDRSRPIAARQPAEDQQHLTPARFAASFNSAWQTLWYIAAAVLGDRSGADDVLQEAAMVALGKLSQFDANSNFLAWMGKIVRFIALNHARRRSKAAAAIVDPHALDAVHATHARPSTPSLDGRGELFAGQDDFDDHILAALQTLDETARACLLLRTLMDMPYRDISLALDIAEGTAMSHVHRARTALREKLAHRLDRDPAARSNSSAPVSTRPISSSSHHFPTSPSQTESPTHGLD